MNLEKPTQSFITDNNAQTVAMQKMRSLLNSFSFEQNNLLSNREAEIIRQLATGKKRSAIARDMFINIETVKSHLKNIYHKLNVHYKEDAINVARANGYIS